ncbi:MAG: GHKL domain-containing protein [Lewinella sp.]|nr:GHKL domain-containing protein [Lewinella sp.]
MQTKPKVGRWMGWLLVLLTGAGLGISTGSPLVGLLWVLGHLLYWPALFPLVSWPLGRRRAALSAGLAALLPYGLAWAVVALVQAPAGWHGFGRLVDLPLVQWVSLAALWPLAVGGWLISLRLLEHLRQQWSGRGPRTLILAGWSILPVLLSWLWPVPLAGLPLLLVTFVFLVFLDFFLDSDRTSLTWLLLWLVVAGAWLAVLIFSQSLRLDQHGRQALAMDIARMGQADTAQTTYPLAYQWSFLSSVAADSLLPPELLQLSPGTGKEVLTRTRSDWVYHLPAGAAYVVVGRPTGGYRPPIVLASLIFLTGLLYSLLVRQLAWLLAFPVDKWALPLYGPASLRMRIQLSFFGLVLVSFLLVGGFTLYFFQGQAHLASGEHDFLFDWLENFLGLYAFLLLVAGAFGIILANSITDPIVRISEKIGDTRLQHNEPLSWPREDEIGRLVANYNAMISALEESADRLAASEREGAWRLMARQVAHEIKNPLTPMKLHLQQLLRLQKEDPEQARRWGERTASTMIEQIDGLARIATAFSDFARLPEPQPTDFELTQLVRETVELHRENESGVRISLHLPPEPVAVRADRDQLVRVLHNLLRNAIEAIPDDRLGQVDLTLTTPEDDFLLVVRDNGAGVPPEVREHIFQPNFTTKSSGTGLGLAMCRNIVERAGGRISLENGQGQGATFWVRWPRQGRAV